MFNIIRGIQSVVDNTPIVDGQMLFTTDTDKIYIDNGTTRIMYRGVPIDSTLSTTSTNAVENQAITNNCGMASNLQTTIKTNIVSAVNELNNSLTNLPTAILSTGSTSVTITDTRITADGLIDIYTDVYGVNPTAIEVSDGSITLNFDAQESDVQVKVRCL